jgi:hypothetical protein
LDGQTLFLLLEIVLAVRRVVLVLYDIEETRCIHNVVVLLLVFADLREDGFRLDVQSLVVVGDVSGNLFEICVLGLHK